MVPMGSAPHWDHTGNTPAPRRGHPPVSTHTVERNLLIYRVLHLKRDRPDFVSLTPLHGANAVAAGILVSEAI